MTSQQKQFALSNNNPITKDELLEPLKRLGLVKGDVVYIHSDLYQFGVVKNQHGKVQLRLTPEVLYEAMTYIIGDCGTVCVPAYTNSWTKGEPFSLKKSKASTGVFSNFICRHRDSLRSMHGLLSLAAIGKNAAVILQGQGKSAFGEDSPYHQLYLSNALLVMVGTGLCAFKDYVEVRKKVPYRYKKLFQGKIDTGKSVLDTHNLHHVRYMDVPMELISFVEAIAEDKSLKNVSLGKGKQFLKAIRTEDAFSNLENKLDQDNYCFVKDKLKEKHFLDIVSQMKQSDFIAVNREGKEIWKFQVDNIVKIASVLIKSKHGEVLDLTQSIQVEKVTNITLMNKTISNYEVVIEQDIIKIVHPDFRASSKNMALSANLLGKELHVQLCTCNDKDLVDSMIVMDIGNYEENAPNSIFKYITEWLNVTHKIPPKITDFLRYLINNNDGLVFWFSKHYDLQKSLLQNPKNECNY